MSIRAAAVVIILGLASLSANQHERQPDKQQGPAQHLTSPSITPQRQFASTPENQRADGESNPSAQWLYWAWDGFVKCVHSSGAADWGLLITAMFGVGYGLRTLKALEIQTNATRESVDSFKNAERAYIALEHTRVYVDCGPDSHGGQDPNKPLSIQLTIEIRNAGRTPGDLLGGFLGWCVAPEPHLPDITRVLRRLTPAFFLPDTMVSFGLGITEDTETLKHLVVTRDGEDRLWLIGQLDYADRFGEFHTFGYGRCFDPKFPTFSFVAETASFNYDRPMHPEKRVHYTKRQSNQ